ncbi:MAG: HlyD family efflux transporter periplasmic adaptor subunit [Kofleriaceae bacterium]
MTARRSETIPASFTGRITRLSITPGQRVRSGDQIAKLDDTDLKSKIEGLLAQEKATRAEAGAYGAIAGAAQKRLHASQKLVAIGYAPRMELATVGGEVGSQGAQAGAASARGGVYRADRAVLERQLKNAQINAPLEGIVMGIKAKEGEVAQQGAPIARIYDPSDLLITFAVPKAMRSQLKKGARVELKIDGVKRPIFASIEDFADEEAPLNITVVRADVDDSKLAPGELTLASVAHVRLADNLVSVK